MHMSDDEIRVSYQQAKSKAAQVGVLADLNGIGKDAMAAKLESLGLTVPPQPVKRPRAVTFDAARALELHHGGQSDLEIAEQLGIHAGTFAGWRRRQGLKANRKPAARKLAARKPAAPAPSDRMTARRLADIFRQIAERHPEVAVKAGGGEVTQVELLSAYGADGAPVLEVCMKCGGGEKAVAGER